MKILHLLPGFAIVVCILVLLALFFLFCMHGYSYISYALLFAAFLILVFCLGPKWLKILVAVFTVLGLGWFCYVESFVISSAHTDKDCQRDYVIVLGAKVLNGEPSLSMQHRLESTLEYLQEYPESKVVCSGGQGADEAMSEAACMKQWFLEHGIAEERILTEDKSTSTMENLKFSLEKILADGGSRDEIAIVSSNYHLYRAKQMAKSLGMENVAGVRAVIGYPVFTLGMFIREAFAVTHLWILGD